jgi:hypothetical protein
MSGIPDEEHGKDGIMKDPFAYAYPSKGRNTQSGVMVVSGDEYVQHDAPKRRAHVYW